MPPARPTRGATCAGCNRMQRHRFTLGARSSRSRHGQWRRHDLPSMARCAPLNAGRSGGPTSGQPGRRAFGLSGQRCHTQPAARAAFSLSGGDGWNEPFERWAFRRRPRPANAGRSGGARAPLNGGRSAGPTSGQLGRRAFGLSGQRCHTQSAARAAFSLSGGDGWNEPFERWAFRRRPPQPRHSPQEIQRVRWICWPSRGQTPGRHPGRRAARAAKPGSRSRPRRLSAVPDA